MPFLVSELALVSFPLQLDSKSVLEAASAHLPLLLASLRSLEYNIFNGHSKEAQDMLKKAAKDRSVVLEM